MPTRKVVAQWSTIVMSLSALGVAIAHDRRRRSSSRPLDGKVALVTGGSRGLGFAIATELAQAGAKLILTARNQIELERAQARLQEAGIADRDDVFIQRADITQPSEVQALVEAGTKRFGQIDIVVNNAGVILVGGIESQTLESFHLAMDVNFFGAIHVTQAVLPQLLQRGTGAIVNIASIGGKIAFPHLLPYTASKFALVGWSQGMRAELLPKGINVTTVVPGVMRTGSHIQARYAGDTEKEYRWFATAASLPLSAVDATKAARKIVRALLNESAEIAIGFQAIAAERLAGVAPGVTSTLMSVASRLLPGGCTTPEGGRNFWGADTSVPGKVLRGSLPRFIERYGDEAMDRYNQVSAGRSSIQRLRAVWFSKIERLN